MGSVLNCLPESFAEHKLATELFEFIDQSRILEWEEEQQQLITNNNKKKKIKIFKNILLTFTKNFN